MQGRLRTNAICLSKVRIKGGPMNLKSDRSVIKCRIKDTSRARSAKPSVQNTEWEITDERLDEALRQTFPASDALSIVQKLRGG
jgi:hypothetical protein